MAEKPQAIFDFLYRDYSRLASYYAQRYSGKLLGVEQTKGLESQKASSGSMNVGSPQILGAKGDAQFSSKQNEQSKQTIDPHDMLVSDTLSFLSSDLGFNTDIVNAKNGELIKVQGTLLLIDSALFKSGDFALTLLLGKSDSVLSYEKIVDEELRSSISEEEFKNAFRESLPQLPSHPMLFLQSNQGLLVGVPKAEYLEEPSSNFTFKYGSFGLPDVTIIAIKEEAKNIETPQSTTYLKALVQLADIFSTLFIPSDGIKITPLAIYREIRPRSS